MRAFFLVFCLFVFGFAKSELLLLPSEAKSAKERIVQLINSSEESIYIAMYNFSYKKFAKALVKAKKRGVNIVVLFDKKKIKEKDSLYEYLNKKGIKTIVSSDKMHLKVALFDEKTFFLGSTNFTKKSLTENHEIVYFDDDKKSIKKLLSFFQELN